MKAARRLACLTACATFVLIVAGGMVTSTGSGMASPDPVLIDGFSGTKLYEHGHRIIGWTVGFLALLTTIAVCTAERRTWVRRLAITGLASVVAQGLLGMLTVKFELKEPAISIVHAALAEAFFGLMVVMAIVTAEGWTRTPIDRLKSATAAVIYIQILLGAWYRHTNTQAALGLHILGILAVGLHVFRQNDNRLLQSLFFVQILLGPLALLLSKGKVILDIPAPLTHAIPVTLHLAAGALMFAVAIRSCLKDPSTLPGTLHLAPNTLKTES